MTNRYRVDSEEYRTGLDYVIVDTQTDRVVRNLGSDYDQAVELCEDFNLHGYWPDPFENTVWSLREQSLDDSDRSTIIEQAHQNTPISDQTDVNAYYADSL